MAYARPSPDYRPAGFAMMPRLYAPVGFADGSIIRLEPGPAHHLIRVLRLGPGAAVEVFDGQGQAALGRLVSTDPCTVTVESMLAPDPSPQLRLSLVQCISAAEKMDWTIEKAVELGAAAIFPLQSQKGIVRLTPERSTRRREHWQRLIVAAASQCGQNRLPHLHEVANLTEWLRAQSAPAPGELRLVLDPRARQSLPGLLAARNAPATGGEVQLLCGAESGFSEAEWETACAAGWLAVTIGPRVLRTETAGLAALAAIQALWGDWGRGRA